MRLGATALCASLGFVCGLAVGGAVARCSVSASAEGWRQAVVWRPALSSYAALQAVRNGDTASAVEILELELDGALAGLAIGSSDFTDEEVALLQGIRRYREAYPRRTGSEALDRAVMRGLSKAP